MKSGGQRIFGVVFVALFAASAGLGFSMPARAVPAIHPDKISTAGHSSVMLAVATNNDTIAEGARSFIQNMADRGIDFLGNPNMSMDSKKDAFKKLLQDSFDMKTIGRFALGRYWRVATPEQRQEYQNLFEKMIINVYSQRFSDYKGEKFEARSVRDDGPKDSVVTSFIVPDQGPEVQVDWRVRYKNGEYKVVDIIVEGVSMSVTQRSDFSSVIQRGGGNVQVLIDHLRN